MAVAVIERFNENHLRSSHRLAGRRHYKKDSRFVLDLYTLTYDSHESLDSLGVLSERRYEMLDVSNSCNNNGNPRTRHPTIFRYRRPNLQSGLQNGEHLQPYFINEQLAEIEDNYIEDTVLSLPAIPHSKYNTLNNSDTNSLPVVNEDISTFPPSTVVVGYVKNNQKNDHNDNNVKSNSNSNYCERVLENHNTGLYQSNKGINWDTTQWTSESQEKVTTPLNIYTETQHQMELQPRPRPDSPITCAIKSSLKKVGFENVRNDDTHCRISRNMMAKMNTNQLKALLNDLYTHAKYLNEQLMEMLIEKDELHMSRDSLLVDIEDLTAYLNANQAYKKNSSKFCIPNDNCVKNDNNYNSDVPVKCTKNLISGLRFSRFTSHIKN